MPRHHPFARRRSVQPRALAGEPYIVREEGSSTRGIAERYLARLAVTLVPAMELGSTEAIREAVAAGLGVALVLATPSGRAIRASSESAWPAVAGLATCSSSIATGTPLGAAAAKFREFLLAQRAAPSSR